MLAAPPLGVATPSHPTMGRYHLQVPLTPSGFQTDPPVKAMATFPGPAGPLAFQGTRDPIRAIPINTTVASFIQSPFDRKTPGRPPPAREPAPAETAGPNTSLFLRPFRGSWQRFRGPFRRKKRSPGKLRKTHEIGEDFAGDFAALQRPSGALYFCTNVAIQGNKICLGVCEVRLFPKTGGCLRRHGAGRTSLISLSRTERLW
jgi:hypothetical protein